METFNQKFSGYSRFLNEIWSRVYSLVVIFVVTFIVGFLSSGTILKYIIHFFNLQNATLVTTSPFQFFDLAMSVGMYAGLIVCLPVFIYHVYGFMREGLNGKEKKFFFVLLPIGVLLFVSGFAYGAFILELTLHSIAAINLSFGIQNVWDITSFLSQIILTATLLGLVFQFPLVLTFLVRVGVLTPGQLKNKRRHAIVAMFIVTSLLPPSDGLSLIVMVLPLIIMYELTIMVNSSYSSKPTFVTKPA